MLMEDQPFIVIPEWGNPLGYFLLERTRGLRWYVEKVFQRPGKAAYHYCFTHLNGQGKALGEAAYPGFALNNNISRADNERAARWFLTSYFSFRELHYVFASVPGLGLPDHYPVLGRYGQVKSLLPQKQAGEKQPPQKPVLQPQDFELSWE